MKYRIPGVLCKLDLEKAYDHVNWEFLSYLLGHLGFGLKWRKWIFACIFTSTACFPILINGSPHGFFVSSRGNHQGDPLSPLLFLIVMEVLCRMLSRATIGVIYLDSMSTSIAQPLWRSLIFFLADDTLIMCDVDQDRILNLGHIVLCFEAISGLKVNLRKSFICGGPSFESGRVG